MTKSGIQVLGSEVRILRNDAVAFTTEGLLVSLLPTEYSWTDQVLDFPEPSKDYIYGWTGTQTYAFDPSASPDHYAQNNRGKVFFTALPEESESSVTLMAAPTGADIFFGLVRLTQTVAPTHTWYGKNLSPFPPTDSWIPWNGSGLIEAALGISRAMHLVIEGGSLKLIAEQSIGPATGGSGPRNYGDEPNIFVTGQSNSGGHFEYGTTPGLITWSSSSSPYEKFSSRNVDTDFLPGQFRTHELTGADPCTTTNPTAYHSTYAVDILGHFGRSS